jgi:xylulose-5-phosphate/fructose-6-phosphate phosphoketolase
VITDLDFFYLFSYVMVLVPKLGERAAYAKQETRDKLINHREHIRRYCDDMPEIRTGPGGQDAAGGAASTEGDNL